MRCSADHDTLGMMRRIRSACAAVISGEGAKISVAICDSEACFSDVYLARSVSLIRKAKVTVCQVVH